MCWLNKEHSLPVKQIVLQGYFSQDVNRPQQPMDFASSVCLPRTSCVQNVISQDGLTICQTACHLCHTNNQLKYLLDRR